ncbi:HAMP domain-containing histidine kinase [Pistricoccus aurantiacus]|uniref:histidine kinase n=1 Tax=Pistricoccus aurantiacus TaxID=1883414 RepID=A0A5B8SPB1_9GAMM|nr:HAMP domain-containing sensor histidine kinase [Pistricoccus aurantiacus]QEA38929.1 HAMP domain-containing histidine kinase [Pistricoccus aurantiacus]
MRRLRDWIAGWSLSRRLLAAALILVMLTLPLVGAGLVYNFRHAVTASFDQHLESLLKVLLADLEIDPASQEPALGLSLGDARFDRVFSGWYWQITDTRGTVLVSRSLWDQRLPVSMAKGLTTRNITGPRGQALRVTERDVRLPNYPHRLHVSVAASRRELDAEVARFEWLLGISLASLALLLLTGLAIQIRWGLAPLRRLQADLEAIENGRTEQLDTRLPGELRRLANAMNEVIERDRRLIERGRAAAGNLAHALKTPVSVLRMLAERLPEASRQRFYQEIQRIDEAVRHHLARASASSGVALGGSAALKDTLAPVIEGLSRLAKRRGLDFECRIEKALGTRMDPQDMQELVGNLLDNALGWAEARVRFAAEHEESGVGLYIDDDGPGMTATQRKAALGRGARLDERRSGSGLGLAIVDDLVTLYRGRLRLDDSPLGGLRVHVWLPDTLSAASD